jgi:transcription elongation factor Elf1
MDMGRRRRRVIKVFKRTLPKVYSCPQCGMISVKVSMKDKNNAIISCANCNLSNTLSINGRESIDLYNEFVDQYSK